MSTLDKVPNMATQTKRDADTLFSAELASWCHEVLGTLAAMRLWGEVLRGNPNDERERERALNGINLSIQLQAKLIGEVVGRASAPNAGSDRARAVSDDQPRPSETAPARSALRTRLEGVRVFIVENDGETRDGLVALLTQFGARVTAMGSAADALDAIRHAPPDVLLSDIGLAGEDGYALIREVRRLPIAEGGRVPAAALTARIEDKDRTAALNAGFQRHIKKPLELAELIDVVAALAQPT